MITLFIGLALIAISLFGLCREWENSKKYRVYPIDKFYKFIYIVFMLVGVFFIAWE